MKILLYILLGIIILRIIYVIGNAIEDSLRKKSSERKMKKRDEEWAREREAQNRRIHAEEEKRKEQQRREEMKKEAEADKLVLKFMRSDLTRAIISEIKGQPQPYVRLKVMNFATDVISIANDGTEMRRPNETMMYHELGFQHLNNDVETRALAKTLAKSLGTEYEYKGYVDSSYGNSYYLVEYKYIDKLKPKLRSAI